MKEGESRLTLQDDQKVRGLRALLPLVGLTLLLQLPFVNQAFHLDDVNYLDIAKNVMEHPLFPLDMSYVFEGRYVSMWGHPHPPLNSYVMAVVLLLNGRHASEVALHVTYLFFPILATISFYFLARRFTRFPVLATAVFSSVPTLQVVAHTLMADVPLLALWLCAMTLFIYGVDRSNLSLERGALVPLIAAVFYAYQGLALIPLLALYAWQRRRLDKWRGAMLCLPILLLIGWQALGYIHRGSTYVVTLFEYLSWWGWGQPAKIARNLLSSFAYLGGTILFFPFLFVAFGRRWWGTSSLLGVVVAAGVAQTELGGYGLTQKIFFVFCFAGGLIATVWVLRGFFASLLRKDHDFLFLSLWFLGVLTYCSLIFITGSARYLLPAAPPLTLLLVRSIESQLAVSRRWRVFYTAVLACQMVLGLALARSDYEFAGTFRQAAQDFQQGHVSPGTPFLFSGEWGFRHYLQALGGHIMADDSVGQPYELVVKSKLCLSRRFDNALDRSLEVVEKRTYRISSPVRLLDQQTKAGFWSDGWGELPFWFSNEPLDQITIYRVRKDP